MSQHKPESQVVEYQIGGDHLVKGGIEEQLAEFTADFNLAPSIVDALAPEKEDLYITGIPPLDESRKKYLGTRKCQTLASIRALHEVVRKHKALAPLTTEVDDRNTRRTIARGQQKGTPLRDPRIWNAAAMRQWIGRLEEYENVGIRQSLIADLLYNFNSMDYGNLLRESDENDAPFSPQDPFSEPYFGLFAGEVEPSKVTFNAVLDRMDDLNCLDRSKETLDARFENFYHLAQLGASQIFLEKTTELAFFGGWRHKRANLLNAEYQDTLFANDYQGRIDMLKALAEAFIEGADKEKILAAGSTLYLLYRNVYKVISDMQEAPVNFGRVYEILGYEKPALLNDLLQHFADEERAALEAEQRAENHQNVADGAGVVAASTSVEIDVQEDVREEIHAEATKLDRDIEEFNRSWLLSSKQKRRAGLMNIHRGLVNGHRGATPLPPQSDSLANGVVNVIGRLHALANAKDATPESAKNELDILLQQQKGLEAAYAALSAAKIDSLQLAEIQQISQPLDWLRTNWVAVRQLVSAKTQHGGAMAKRLEQFFFSK